MACPALGRGRPDTFFLIKKYPKNQVRKEASLPHGPLPCRPDKNRGLHNFAANAQAIRTWQKDAMPFATTQGLLFLSALTRSLFSDGLCIDIKLGKKI
jgi:hypothetical protein